MENCKHLTRQFNNKLMCSKLQCSRQFSEEVKQKQAITESLINKILYSKRLLVDHVEALEQCILYVQYLGPKATDNPNAAATSSIAASPAHNTAKENAAAEIFTARNACVLLCSTILEHLVTPKWLRLTLIPSVLIAGGFSAMYVTKNMFVFRNKIVERNLEQLIRTIDDFGNCIRRNMTYFNEIIIMKQQELIESRQIERAWDCITAAKEVTEILFDATRKLEEDYLLPAKYMQYYSPMEELRECEYFKHNITDYSPKHIKEFHNIFAYVQSQYLMRLALTILTKPSISGLNMELLKINSLIRQLVQEEESHFQNLTLELNKKKQLEIELLNATKSMRNRSGPVAVLQDSSLKLSARMVAVAAECQAMDITLQRLTEAESRHNDNANQLLQVVTNMRSIESALSICFDDFQRLMLVYGKFLSNKLQQENSEENKPELNNAAELNEQEFADSILRIEISQQAENNKDDFYAYMFDEENAQQQQQQPQAKELEILNFEERITKGKFKPVLKQLKHRIDPIRQCMLEKEREVLAAKGFNVDKLFLSNERMRTKSPAKKSVHFTDVLEETPAASARTTTAEPEDSSSCDTSDDSEASVDLSFKKQKLRTKQLKERDNFAEMRNFLAQKQAINLFQKNMPPAALAQAAAAAEDILESEC